MIDSPQELHIAIRQMLGQVAGAIQTTAGMFREGIGDELFRGQLWSVEIAACDSHAADVHFAGYTDGNWLHFTIQDINAHILNRKADWLRSWLPPITGNEIVHAANDRLGGSILIDQCSFRRVFLPEGDVIGNEVFTANDECTRSAFCLLRQKLMTQHLQMRGCDLDQAEIGLTMQPPAQSFDVV